MEMMTTHGRGLAHRNSAQRILRCFLRTTILSQIPLLHTSIRLEIRLPEEDSHGGITPLIFLRSQRGTLDR